MKHGPARFTFYLDKLEALMVESSKQPDPAAWLFQNGARTPLFMLEGLARLYSKLHDKKSFEKISERAKSLEDAVGAIDYYDGFAKELADDASTPRAVLEFTRRRADEETASLNKILTEDNWIGPDAKRIARIRERLNELDWLDDKDEVEAIGAYYKKNIAKISKFANEHKAGFTELETQVHELRRQLRWLSIYPQALQGLVQLTDTPSNDLALAKYLTPEITGSPFNKMPPAGTNKHSLVLGRDNFLALSWMIAELGRLKDQGLRTELFREAGHASDADQAAEAAILKQASDICRTYFVEGRLNRLLHGVKSVS